MDEETLRRTLLAVGIIALLGSVIAAWQAMPLLQQAVSPVYTSLLCNSVNGTYVFAQPTSSEFCSRYGNSMGKVEDTWCSFYPGPKADACRKLADVLLDRWADCFAFRLSKETDYAQGAPQVTEYCRQLSS